MRRTACGHDQMLLHARIKGNPINLMLSYTITFLIIALIAGALGFAGVAGTATWIAHVCFVVFLVLFLISLVSGRRPPVV
jgi:uncharacterized membrane protein YtjA (UPF0391 family)